MASGSVISQWCSGRFPSHRKAMCLPVPPHRLHTRRGRAGIRYGSDLIISHAALTDQKPIVWHAMLSQLQGGFCPKEITNPNLCYLLLFNTGGRWYSLTNLLLSKKKFSMSSVESFACFLFSVFICHFCLQLNQRIAIFLPQCKVSWLPSVLEDLQNLPIYSSSETECIVKWLPTTPSRIWTQEI